MGTYSDLVKKYFAFSSSEINGIILGSLFLGFMFSFREWGADKFDLLFGLRSFVSSMLIVAFVFLFYISVQKLFALSRGYTAEFKTWIYGLLVALVFNFVTRGYIVAVVPGGIFLSHMGGQRLGKFQYGLRAKDIGTIALMGPVATIILAIIFKFLAFSTGNVLIQKALSISLWFAFFTMLPIPSLDGANVFFYSRTMWAFSFSAIAVSALLIYFYSSILTSIIAAIIVGIFSAVLWGIYAEK